MWPVCELVIWHPIRNNCPIPALKLSSKIFDWALTAFISVAISKRLDFSWFLQGFDKIMSL